MDFWCNHVWMNKNVFFNQREFLISMGCFWCLRLQEFKNEVKKLRIHSKLENVFLFSLLTFLIPHVDCMCSCVAGCWTHCLDSKLIHWRETLMVKWSWVPLAVKLERPADLVLKPSLNSYVHIQWFVPKERLILSLEFVII